MLDMMVGGARSGKEKLQEEGQDKEQGARAGATSGNEADVSYRTSPIHKDHSGWFMRCPGMGSKCGNEILLCMP